MARKVFYSLNYLPDSFRTYEVRHLAAVEGNHSASDDDWELIKSGGVKAVQNWIDAHMEGRNCTIVLIGQDTAKRKWIDYEIRKSWVERKGVLGIHVHHLKDAKGVQTKKGANPFDHFTVEQDDVKLSSIVKTYDPPFTNQKAVFEYISRNIAGWTEEAIKIRSFY